MSNSRMWSAAGSRARDGAGDGPDVGAGDGQSKRQGEKSTEEAAGTSRVPAKKSNKSQQNHGLPTFPRTTKKPVSAYDQEKQNEQIEQIINDLREKLHGNLSEGEELIEKDLAEIIENLQLEHKQLLESSYGQPYASRLDDAYAVYDENDCEKSVQQLIQEQCMQMEGEGEEEYQPAEQGKTKQNAEKANSKAKQKEKAKAKAKEKQKQKQKEKQLEKEREKEKQLEKEREMERVREREKEAQLKGKRKERLKFAGERGKKQKPLKEALKYRKWAEKQHDGGGDGFGVGVGVGVGDDDDDSDGYDEPRPMPNKAKAMASRKQKVELKPHDEIFQPIHPNYDHYGYWGDQMAEDEGEDEILYDDGNGYGYENENEMENDYAQYQEYAYVYRKPIMRDAASQTLEEYGRIAMHQSEEVIEMDGERIRQLCTIAVKEMDAMAMHEIMDRAHAIGHHDAEGKGKAYRAAAAIDKAVINMMHTIGSRLGYSPIIGPNGIVIRPFKTADFLNMVRSDLLCLPANVSMQHYFYHFVTWPALCYVAENVDHEIVGYAVSKIKEIGSGYPPVGFITSLGVKQGYFDYGVGQKIMCQVAIAMREFYGVKYVTLVIRQHNHAAFKLYHHNLGFKIIQVIPKYFIDGETAYYMSAKTRKLLPK